MTICGETQEEAGEDIHHRRPRRDAIPSQDRNVKRKAVEEEQRSLKVFDPVAVPSCAGIHPDHRQHHKRPKQEEAVSGEGLPDPKSAHELRRRLAGQKSEEQYRGSHSVVSDPLIPRSKTVNAPQDRKSTSLNSSQ